MAIVYSEQFETKKATTNVAGTGANYRIEYIVRNPVGAAINSITATISQVATEGEGETQTENNRTYFAIERHAEVTADNQAALAAQYFADVKSILTV